MDVESSPPDFGSAEAHEARVAEVTHRLLQQLENQTVAAGADALLSAYVTLVSHHECLQRLAPLTLTRLGDALVAIVQARVATDNAMRH